MMQTLHLFIKVASVFNYVYKCLMLNVKEERARGRATRRGRERWRVYTIVHFNENTREMCRSIYGKPCLRLSNINTLKLNDFFKLTV